ncbi:hypothetical protein DYB32_007416 [Aphanomyces invadans]|uniref:Rapamycin-insensitive companion of mTOR domain-containing protein n=1 Tax=Aphanomyces invadans TaxID=157072 RepID=A0A3R6YV94_9STRA|nr:hypothetical protein DYB32_007416 [Aphanomyces invadans]
MAAYQVLETTCRLIDRGGLDRRTKLEATGRITHEMKKDPMLLEVFAVERIQNCARGLMSDTDTSVRTAALRVLRYSMINSASTAQAIKLVRRFDALTDDDSCRAGCTLVVRRFMDIDALQVPTSVVRSIVAIANHKEDNLRRVALETLRELAIANVSVVMQCNGMKTLVDCILDPTCQDIAEALLMTLIYLINEPANRNLIHSFVNVQVLLAPFTDTDSPAGTERRQRWTASRNAIVMMMRSWTVSRIVADYIFTALSSGHSRLAMSDKPIVSTHGGTNLLDNYMVLVLLSLGHCGLLEALVALEPAIELLSEVLHLSARLLPDQHCAMLLALPQLVATTAYSKVDYLADLQSKPPEDRGEREHAIRASEMLAELARAVGASSSSGGLVTRQNPSTVNGVHLASELLRGTNRPLHNFNVHSQRDSAREMLVYDLKVHLDNQMDDHTFRDLLMHKSRVLYGKDWFRWNWDIISELLEGPLTNPARLSEAMKTKFFKRVSGFFRCDNSDKGMLLEGRPEATIVESHLGELQSRMFRYVVVDSSRSCYTKSWLCSPEYCSRRMLREYFTLLGLMSSSPEGICAVCMAYSGVFGFLMHHDVGLKMMQRIFARLTKLGTVKDKGSFASLDLSKSQRAVKDKSQSHDFLCRLILANLDYTVEGSSRQLLTDWMNYGSESLRLYATCLLRALLRSEIEGFERWGIESLVAQLDKEPNVARAALSVLEEAAEQSPVYLSAMIKKRSLQFVHLQAESLLLKFLSLPEGTDQCASASIGLQCTRPLVPRRAVLHIGLAFLKDVPNWISSNLMQWRQVKYVQYVHLVESQLLCGVFRDKQSVTTNASKAALKPVPIPVTVPNRRSSNFKHGPHREQWGKHVASVGSVNEVFGRHPCRARVALPHAMEHRSQARGTPRHSDGNPLSTIRIKGVVVDARNIPKPVMVNSQQTLQACLFLGAQPVDRKGHTRPAPTTNGGFPAPNDKEPGSAVAAASATAPPIRSRTESRGVTDRLSEFSMDSSTAYEAPEENKDWSSCGPEHRTAAVLFNAAINTNASGSEKEARLCPAGERAVWTFDMDTDNQQIKRVQLKSVEFTIQLLPTKAPTVPLPRHFYGELAKTEDGCAILRQSGHLSELVASLKDPTVVPLEKRAALWTLGHIAGTNRGYVVLRMPYADDLVECIVHMATSCQLLSLRGTSIFALGLISRSSAGRRALSQAGWIAPRGSNVSIAVPNNVASLFEWPSVSHTPFPSELVDLSTSFVSPNFIKSGKASAKAKEILRLIGDLSSTISQKEAGASLNRMKGAHPELFEDTETALAAHTILARYHYRLSARQFVMNLFEKADLSNASLNQYLYQGEESAQVVPQGGRRRRSSVNAPSLSSTIQSLLHSHSKETVLATARHIPDHENTIFVGASEALV